MYKKSKMIKCLEKKDAREIVNPDFVTRAHCQGQQEWSEKESNQKSRRMKMNTPTIIQKI